MALTGKRIFLPSLTGEWSVDGPMLYRALTEYLLSLESADSLRIGSAALVNCTIDDTVIGGETAAAGTFTDLTTTGNTTLGNASTDTLNVGNGGLIKDASGNVGIGESSGTARLAIQSSGNTDSELLQQWREPGGTVGEFTLYGEFAGSGASGNAIRIGSAIGGWASNILTFKGDGRIYGGALHNNAGAVTGTTNQYVASGTYTPTITGVTNVSSSTAYVCSWMRVGNVVTVSGRVSITPTAAAPTNTVFRITLPIASSLTAQEQLGGAGTFSGAALQPALVEGDATNDAAQFTYSCDVVGGSPLSFTFTYEVL